MIPDFFLRYGAPSLGCIMANAMFAAAVDDLKQALKQGSLGDLNTFPWAVMTGNTLGWVTYGYIRQDIFVVAANMPGFILSLWLNSGAAKLEYKMRDDDRQDGSIETKNGVMVPQERALITVLTLWALVLTYIGWFNSHGHDSAAMLVGVINNINLVLFYGAPLKTMQTVIKQRTSASIHLPTMYMNLVNTTFWIVYGVTIKDYFILVPNVLGLMMGITQCVLCIMYPRGRASNDIEDLNEPLIVPADQDSMLVL